MAYLSERQRNHIINLVRDMDASVRCDVIKSDEHNDGFFIVLDQAGSQVRLPVTEDDLEHAVDDPRSQSEMRWRIQKALQGRALRDEE